MKWMRWMFECADGLWLMMNVWMCFVDFPAWYSWLAADTEVYLEASPLETSLYLEHLFLGLRPTDWISVDWLESTTCLQMIPPCLLLGSWILGRGSHSQFRVLLSVHKRRSRTMDKRMFLAFSKRYLATRCSTFFEPLLEKFTLLWNEWDKCLNVPTVSFW